MSSTTKWTLVAIGWIALHGCEPKPVYSTVGPDGDAVMPSPGVRARPGVRFVEAEQGDVATVIRAKRAEVERVHGTLLVYVGATWCEPCQYFHRAVQAGGLDSQFPGLTMLEFDMDRDGTRLAAAGYAPRMIPFFVVPNEDGRASTRSMEGSIHGPQSVQEIVPRLRALIGTTAPQ